MLKEFMIELMVWYETYKKYVMLKKLQNVEESKDLNTNKFTKLTLPIKKKYENKKKKKIRRTYEIHGQA